MRARRLILSLCALCLLFAEARAASPSSPGEDEERRLWLRAEEEVKKLDAGPQLYRHAEMERYLAEVVRRLVPPETLERLPLSFGIIRDRGCNAFIFPNGRGYIHTGMLAVVENEAQLAAVLAHESVHALNRHMIKELREAREKTALSSFVGIATGNLLTPFGHLGALASVMGYSRDLEAEADRDGFRMLVAAGYDPYEAPKVFALLKKEAQSEQVQESFFFASHPKLRARIDGFNALLAAEPVPAGGKSEAERYLKTFGPLLLDNAEMDLKAGRFERARECLERYLAGRGESARAYLLFGESYRQDRKNPDLAKAREYYLKSAQADPRYPEPHRVLGLLAFKEKDRERARKSLEEYLRLAPAAADRGYIEGMLKNLQ